jgi:hypothetical protein
MKLQQRKALLVRLGNYMLGDDEAWRTAQQKAFTDNNWFIPEFIHTAVQSVAANFLTEEALGQMIERYGLPEENQSPKKVGIVMAGNIPLVGFHDFLCVFLSGHKAIIKPSSKDEALIKHLVQKLQDWDQGLNEWIYILPLIRNCDAYIATGSNNSSRYFEYYFRKYPSIIRRNRTSVAILAGDESKEQLESLADDVYLYFGLGCRNITKIYVPHNYDFLPLLEAFRKWDRLIGHHKYKNNYDYNLAVQIINNKYYMTNGSILLVENKSPFSPIGQLNYQFYTDKSELPTPNEELQCIVGHENTGFGKAQTPQICDFADGVDTMQFLISIK